MDKVTLLVVDDVAMNRDIIRNMVGDDYEVVEADSGQAAMRVVEARDVDIVVTDIFMEPMNGYELIQNLRSRDEYKKIPIIAVTESDQASRKRALQAGADDLIYHPYVSRILNNRVQGLLLDGFDMVRYRSAYENNPVPFMLYRVIDRPDTPNYKILYLNKTARGLFAPPVAEDLMRTDELPEQRDFIFSAVRTGEAQNAVVYSQHMGKWLDLTVYPDGNGLVAAMVHDVTDQIREQTELAHRNEAAALKSRDQLSQTLENLPAGVLVLNVTDGAFEVVQANAALCGLLDIDAEKAASATRNDMLALVHPKDVSVALEAVSRLSVPDSNVGHVLRFYHRAKAEYVWMSVQSRSKMQQGGAVYAFSNFVDVTAERQLAEARLELLAAQKANQAKNDFLSRLSHDMRTPMNGILGLVELLQDRNDLAKIKEGLQQIELSGHYLLNLMNDTLDISKIEAGTLSLREKPVDSVTLMRNVLGTAQLMASNKGVQLKVTLPPIPKGEWKPIIADAARLEQVLINIISNAIKFTPENGVVEIDMQTVSVTGQEVVDRYVVRDTGIGMAADFLPHACEPFSQEGRLTESLMNGTGLGLSIAQQLVELMGGQMQIDSTQGKGTCVTLTMHYRTYDGALAQGSSVDSLEVLNGARVLLCEDHPLNAKIAMKILERVGVRTDLASDGSLGVRMFESAAAGYYDAVLMDVRMPVMDGLEATRAIRSCGKPDAATVPIVAMTANAFAEDVDACKAAGMNEHLAKPIDSAKLFETLAGLIAGR